jgi:hypothetical protein
MLQAASESRSKTFEWYFHFKSGHRTFEYDPHPSRPFPPTISRWWHVCEKSLAMTYIWLSERLQRKSEYHSVRARKLLRESEICALSPESGGEGRSRVHLHWPLWWRPKRSKFHVLGNHWWRMLSTRIWLSNKTDILPVEHGIISLTQECVANEVQCQDHVDWFLNIDGLVHHGYVPEDRRQSLLDAVRSDTPKFGSCTLTMPLLTEL